jgi:hypothetical protein
VLQHFPFSSRRFARSSTQRVIRFYPPETMSQHGRCGSSPTKSITNRELCMFGFDQRSWLVSWKARHEQVAALPHRPRLRHNCAPKQLAWYYPIEGSTGVSSMVRCIVCGAEMRVAQVEQDQAMKSAGYEHRQLECVGCQKTERRLAFSGDPASWPIEYRCALASLRVLAAQWPRDAVSYDTSPQVPRRIIAS